MALGVEPLGLLEMPPRPVGLALLDVGEGEIALVESLVDPVVSSESRSQEFSTLLEFPKP